MTMKILGVAAVLLLLGAGCTPTTNTPSETDTTTTEETSTGPVPFSTVGSSVMDSKYYESTNPEGFMSYTFTEGTGSCAEDGLVDFAYQMDDSLGYFVVATADGSYKEPWTSLDFTGQIGFGFPLTSGDADCLVDTSVGSDTATARCTRTDEADEDVEPVEVCTGTYTVMASK